MATLWHAYAWCIVFWLIVNLVSSASPYEVRGGLVISQLKLVALQQQISSLVFGNSTHSISLSAHPQDGLIVHTGDATLASFSPNGTTTFSAEQCEIKSALNIEGDFMVNGISQWRLFHNEDFDFLQAVGWDHPSPNIITQCAGISMLGGYSLFSKGEISKQFGGIPPHAAVRVKANFHFIDAWGGETGFMRVSIGQDGSLLHVWTDRHNEAREAKQGINICGGPTPESRFSVPIDVTIPHSTDSLTISFGSTIESDDPKDVSWGVSSLEIYIR